MSELGVFAYCAAMGFVTAATVASFYQWITSERADFAIAKITIPAIFLSVLLGMFGGPYIVVQKVVAGLKSHELHAVPACLAVLVAGMWSVCAGIFYVSLLVGV